MQMFNTAVKLFFELCSWSGIDLQSPKRPFDICQMLFLKWFSKRLLDTDKLWHCLFWTFAIINSIYKK